MFSAFVSFVFFALAAHFLFPMKQCVPTTAVSLSALAYELAHELAVSNLCALCGSRTWFIQHGYEALYIVGLRALVAAWLEGGILHFFQCYADCSKATQS